VEVGNLVALLYWAKTHFVRRDQKQLLRKPRLRRAKDYVDTLLARGDEYGAGLT
jgi:hypothetical protein